jgi:signal transduction histidine kinase
VTASQARIVVAADHARRKIERDLHDGAQQRLVSLSLQLRAAQAALPPGLGEQMDRAVAEAASALDELRETARGIHPAALADGGLRPALRTLARRSPVPVRLEVRADRRLPEPVEVSAYYVVAEALTNVAKHARATAVTITVETGTTDASLRLTVRDDGAGGADLTRGTGLTGIKDRVEALGGRIFLNSPLGAGTSLQAEFPLTTTGGLPSPNRAASPCPAVHQSAAKQQWSTATAQCRGVSGRGLANASRTGQETALGVCWRSGASAVLHATTWSSRVSSAARL